jgi:hypothetical protein
MPGALFWAIQAKLIAQEQPSGPLHPSGHAPSTLGMLFERFALPRKITLNGHGDLMAGIVLHIDNQRGALLTETVRMAEYGRNQGSLRPQD